MATARERLADDYVYLLKAGIQPWNVADILPVRPKWAVNRAMSMFPLIGVMHDMGFVNPLFLTYREISSLDGKINEGEKASGRDYYWTKGETREGEEFPRLAYVPVWNVEQTDLDASKIVPAEQHPTIKAAEVALDGVTIKDVEGIATPTYAASKDRVRVPALEKSASEYFANRFYGLALATGHEHRLARRTADGNPAKYGAETLTAVMTASVLGALSGTSVEFDQFDAETWAREIGASPQLVITAGAAADKAVKLLAHLD